MRAAKAALSTGVQGKVEGRQGRTVQQAGVAGGCWCSRLPIPRSGGGQAPGPSDQAPSAGLPSPANRHPIGPAAPRLPRPPRRLLARIGGCRLGAPHRSSMQLPASPHALRTGGAA